MKNYSISINNLKEQVAQSIRLILRGRIQNNYGDYRLLLRRDPRDYDTRRLESELEFIRRTVARDNAGIATVLLRTPGFKNMRLIKTESNPYTSTDHWLWKKDDSQQIYEHHRLTGPAHLVRINDQITEQTWCVYGEVVPDFQEVLTGEMPAIMRYLENGHPEVVWQLCKHGVIKVPYTIFQNLSIFEAT